jgi:general secretion pathway protein J
MKPASRSGFTLVEMLVGLALLGLMTLLLFGALRFSIRSWDRAETKTLQVVDLRIVEGVLRREIAKAFPLRIGLANENKIAFEGDGRQVHFVTALPAHLSGGGQSLIALELADDRVETKQDLPGKALVLKHVIPDGETRDFSALDKSDRSVLLEGLEDVEFAYFGRDNDQTEASWRTQWTPSARIPALLRIKLKFAGSDEVREMLLPLRLGEEAGCFQSTFQRMCGPRR